MDKEQAKELLIAVNEANNGNWLPFTLLASMFCVIIMLILILGKRILKENKTEHIDMRALLTVANDNQTSLTALVTYNKETNIRQAVEIQHLKDK